MTSEIINNRPVYVKKGGTIAMGIWWSCNSWRISSLSKKGKCAGMKTYTDEFCVGNVEGYDWEWQPTKNNWGDAGEGLMVECKNFSISKNEEVTTFKEWGTDYKIEFDIVVLNQPKDVWNSAFQFTIGQNGKKIGCRSPALWINKSGYLHFCTSYKTTDLPWGNCFNYDFEFGQNYHVVIAQFQDENGISQYEIEIDGQIVHSIQNDDAQSFSNVKFYASNPWDPSFTSDIGLIENFKILPGNNFIRITTIRKLLLISKFIVLFQYL